MMKQKSWSAPGMTISCSRDELVAKLGDRLARRVDPRQRAGALGRPAPRRGRGARARRDRHGAVAAHVARCAGRRRGRRGRPREAARRPGAASARERGHARVPAGGGRRAGHVRGVLLAAEHVQRRGLPAAAEHSTRRCTRVDRACAARDDGACRDARVAGRVAPGAHRHPRSLRGRHARHGRDRLVPDVRQGDGARARPGPELEAIIPARALQELAGIGGDSETDRARRAGEPRGLRHRRRLADDAPHRRPVPELPAAAARELRGRADAAARRAARRRPPRRR